MRAGFAEIDITPPIGTHKIGWLKVIVSESVLDPLFARAAVFEGAGKGAGQGAGKGAGKVGFIQLDTLSIRWTQVNEIRRRIERKSGFPGANIMISATHNHAGPAVSATGMVKRDDGYVEILTQKSTEVFLEAIDNMSPAELGFGHTPNFEIAKNRRVVMRDGTVKTHGTFADPDALYLEGPIDPEVAVLAVRTPIGAPLGCIVNYGCHPTHYGGDPELSAGYPGVFSNDMKSHGWPVPLFLNGPSGNIHTTNPIDGVAMTMEAAGKSLADSAVLAIADAAFADDWRLSSTTAAVDLRYRDISDEEARGEVQGAQRFVDPGIYDALMPRLMERISKRKTQPAEVQVVGLARGAGNPRKSVAIAGIPAEYFVEFGLEIKTSAPAGCHALIAAHTNGMVGYVPTEEGFRRGGYETTLSLSSRMAPGAGAILAETAQQLIRGVHHGEKEAEEI